MEREKEFFERITKLEESGSYNRRCPMCGGSDVKINRSASKVKGEHDNIVVCCRNDYCYHTESIYQVSVDKVIGTWWLERAAMMLNAKNQPLVWPKFRPGGTICSTIIKMLLAEAGWSREPFIAAMKARRWDNLATDRGIDMVHRFQYGEPVSLHDADEFGDEDLELVLLLMNKRICGLTIVTERESNPNGTVSPEIHTIRLPN